jgi:hypothetical protein
MQIFSGVQNDSVKFSSIITAVRPLFVGFDANGTQIP